MPNALKGRVLSDLSPSADAATEISLFASLLEDSTREWRDELREVSGEAMVWQPFPGAHSIGAILLHIADVEGWWIEEVAARRPRDPEEVAVLLSEETKVETLDWPVPPKQPLSWYYEKLDRVRKRTLNTLREFDDPARVELFGEKHAFSVRWILGHVIGHDSYHGGQAVLLKLLWMNRDRFSA